MFLLFCPPKVEAKELPPLHHSPPKKKKKEKKKRERKGRREGEKERNLREDWIILSLGEKKLWLLQVVNMLMSTESLQEEKRCLVSKNDLTRQQCSFPTSSLSRRSMDSSWHAFCKTEVKNRHVQDSYHHPRSWLGISGLSLALAPLPFIDEEMSLTEVSSLDQIHRTIKPNIAARIWTIFAWFQWPWSSHFYTILLKMLLLIHKSRCSC